MLKEIIAAISRLVHGGAQTPEATAAELDALAAKRNEKLYWRVSIVDLLKLLDMDYRLDARQKLASEMGRVGSFSGTSSDNEWLHGEVLKAIGQRDIAIPKT